MKGFKFLSLAEQQQQKNQLQPQLPMKTTDI